MDELKAPVEEDYDSASDEDFNPDAAVAAQEAAENEESSSNEEGAAGAGKAKRKAAAEVLNFDNSGDEATIQKSKRKKRQGGDNDEGGEGGLIKTRAQRRAEAKERKPLVKTETASVDVEALWAQMATTKKADTPQQQDDRTGKVNAVEAQALSDGEPTATSSSLTNGTASSIPKNTINVKRPRATASKSNGEEMIAIKRRYDFAGETMTEERTVLASSAEARLYLEQQRAQKEIAPGTGTATGQLPPKPGIRRPKKRASIFDTLGAGAAASPAAQKGPKLNTLEKSKLDWAKHVDTEGITDELDEHRKAKDTYLGRMEFLGRMDAKKEEELRNAKLKTKQ